MLPALWEIIIPLILAVLLGIVIGWLMWRWRRRIVSETQWLILEQKVRTLEAENAELRAGDERALDACRDDLEAARDGLGHPQRGFVINMQRGWARCQSIQLLKDEAKILHHLGT